MTKEDKDLLMRDLSGRLPYKVRCKCINGLGGGETDYGVLKFIGNCNGVISNYYEEIPIDSGVANNVFYPIENMKPYLRSFSNMTEKEKEHFEELTYSDYEDFETTTGRRMILATDSDTGYGSEYFSENISEVLDWLNKHHFDYRGLIEKGLALEAQTNMYNN